MSSTLDGVPAKRNRIRLIFTDKASNHDHDVVFRTKTSARLEVIVNRYRAKRTEALTMFSFLYHGRPVNVNSTPEKLGMKDGDHIHVITQITKSVGLDKKIDGLFSTQQKQQRKMDALLHEHGDQQQVQIDTMFLSHKVAVKALLEDHQEHIGSLVQNQQQQIRASLKEYANYGHLNTSFQRHENIKIKDWIKEQGYKQQEHIDTSFQNQRHEIQSLLETNVNEQEQHIDYVFEKRQHEINDLLHDHVSSQQDQVDKLFQNLQEGLRNEQQRHMSQIETLLRQQKEQKDLIDILLLHQQKQQSHIKTLLQHQEEQGNQLAIITSRLESITTSNKADCADGEEDYDYCT